MTDDADQPRDEPGDIDFPLPTDEPAPPPQTPLGSAEQEDAGLDDWPDLTLREEPDEPPPADDAEEFYDGSTYGLGPASELPDLDPPPPPRVTAPSKSKGEKNEPEPETAPEEPPGPPAAPAPRKPPGPAPPPAAGPVTDVPEPALPPRVSASDELADDRPRARGSLDGGGRSAKPKLRDWLEARCRKEGLMYAMGTAVIGSVAAAVTWFTWFILYKAAYGEGWVAVLVSVAELAGLFFLERVTREPRETRLRVEPDDRDLEPVSLDLPRGTGMTWMMYLAGSRDLPGILRFIAGVVLFGPRLCELVWQMGRTAASLWTYDADAMAAPMKTLVRAEGKVSFGAFLEAHRSPPPQEMMDRLALIDGVLFLPNSNPPGLCTSNALKDEFAAWRERWQEERTAGPLYD